MSVKKSDWGELAKNEASRQRPAARKRSPGYVKTDALEGLQDVTDALGIRLESTVERVAALESKTSDDGAERESPINVLEGRIKILEKRNKAWERRVSALENIVREMLGMEPGDELE